MRRHEFSAVQPVLAAVPSATLALWESEWALWAPDANVVPYAGSLASRAVLMDHELWLNASSLDGKLTGKLKDEMPAEVRPADALHAGRPRVRDLALRQGQSRPVQGCVCPTVCAASGPGSRAACCSPQPAAAAARALAPAALERLPCRGAALRRGVQQHRLEGANTALDPEPPKSLRRGTWSRRTWCWPATRLW